MEQGLWSFSKADLYRFCPRAYYYRYLEGAGKELRGFAHLAASRAALRAYWLEECRDSFLYAYQRELRRLGEADSPWRERALALYAYVSEHLPKYGLWERLVDCHLGGNTLSVSEFCEVNFPLDFYRWHEGKLQFFIISQASEYRLQQRVNLCYYQASLRGVKPDSCQVIILQIEQGFEINEMPYLVEKLIETRSFLVDSCQQAIHDQDFAKLDQENICQKCEFFQLCF